ncbi:hypothetical protein [Rickettsiella endosymbiont of Dermanyssus gallinae]|uniref:hypothetical protein n=1 Tax=Rickettsiella endosymbiont of Dermanyssus gallinae TaxID=2856608 RepID=UPI001C52EB50|nr:hypothetical protein [Rickettsiella endosymbiont of Dermanyssus gallinae]
MSANAKEYIFTECYREQLISALWGESLAFHISLSDKFLPLETEAGERVKRKITITVSESRLPRHCNPELVEHALASLEKNPENLNLLKTLGDYTKNNRFGRIGYWSGLGLIAIFFFVSPYAFSFAVFAVCFPLLFVLNPITAYLSTFLVIFSIPISISLLLNKSLDHLGLKVGRWIEELARGIKQPVNLQALDEKLNEFINEQSKTSPCDKRLGHVLELSDTPMTNNITQAKKRLESPVSGTATEQTATFAKIYPSLLFSNDADLTVRDAPGNIDASFQAMPKNR